MTRETLMLIALQSGALFLALWGIFRLIPSIPANAKAWMWRLAFLKPLLSLLPFAVVTLPVLPAPSATPVTATANDPGPASASEFISTEALTLPASAESATRVEEVGAGTPVVIDPLLAAWYFGVLLVAGYSIRGTYRSHKAVRQAQPIERVDLQTALGELLAKAHVEKPTRLLSSTYVQSAMLVGGRSYNILLPQEAVDGGNFQDLRLMLAHEVARIARRDLIWFWLTSTVQSLFFFNPMVWIAARCSRLDHESATDRHASQLAGVPVQTYAEMLLRATVVTRPVLAPGSLPVAESYRTIHRRLEAMKHFNTKPTFWRRTATAALAMLTLTLLPAYELSAAAYPDGYNPEDQGLVAQVSPPEVTIAQVKATKASKVQKAEKVATVVTLPVQTVKGKDGKVRYFVRTKKGLVEVEKSQVIRSAPKSVIAVKAKSAKPSKASVATPAIVKPSKARASANPIRAIVADPAGVTARPATVDPTTGAATAAQGIDPTVVTGARTVAIQGQSVTVTQPAGQGSGTVVASGNAKVTTTHGLATTHVTPLGRQSVPGYIVAQGSLDRNHKAYGQVAKSYGLSGKALTANAPLVNLQGERLATYGSGLASQTLGLTTGRKLPQNVNKGLYGTLTAAQAKDKSTAIGSLFGGQNSRNTVNMTYRTLLGQDKGKGTSTTLRSLYGTNPKIQIVNTGDGKVKVIDANGKTKVYELKKGAVYEFDGREFREIKPEKVTTVKGGATTWIANSRDGVAYRYGALKDGKWQIIQAPKEGKGTWRLVPTPGRADLWKIEQVKGSDGKFQWRIVGPDGKVKIYDDKVKIDPTKTEPPSKVGRGSEDPEAAANTTG